MDSVAFVFSQRPIETPNNLLWVKKDDFFKEVTFTILSRTYVTKIQKVLCHLTIELSEDKGTFLTQQYCL